MTLAEINPLLNLETVFRCCSNTLSHSYKQRNTKIFRRGSHLSCDSSFLCIALLHSFCTWILGASGRNFLSKVLSFEYISFRGYIREHDSFGWDVVLVLLREGLVEHEGMVEKHTATHSEGVQIAYLARIFECVTNYCAKTAGGQMSEFFHCLQNL